MTSRTRLAAWAATTGRALVAGGVLLGAPLDRAAAQEACATYTVVPGDTLRAIGIRAFGTDRADQIYAANRDILRSPDAIEVGQVLRLPCADGSLPIGQEALRALQPADPRIALTALPPFVTEDGAGILVEALERGFAYAGAALPARAPGPPATGDVRFAVLQPVCAGRDISDADRALCSDYVFSQPLGELRYALLTRADGAFARARRLAALDGARFCVAAGYRGPDPAAASLVPAGAAAVRMPDCPAAVARGAADVALVNGDVTAPPGLVALAPLAQTRAVVIAAPRGPAAAALLARLTAALVPVLAAPDWPALRDASPP